jgi:DNA-binding IclR family transcriptional regulator
MPNEIPVKSLKKALDILDLLLFRADGEGMSLTVLAQTLGLPANTAHNLLKTMMSCGYAEQTDGNRYRAGGKWRQAARLHHFLAREPIFRELREAARRLDETCVLVTLANGDRLVIGRADGSQAVQVAATAIDAGLIYDSPTGRVLFAFAEDSERRSVVTRHGIPGERWDGIDDAVRLDAAADRIRAVGCCRILTRDLAAVAVPVLGPGGELLGALGAYAPLFRCPQKRQDELIRELRKIAATLSQL